MNIPNTTPSTLEENEPTHDIPQASGQSNHSEPPLVENYPGPETELDAGQGPPADPGAEP